jgi:hypothetical protein
MIQILILTPGDYMEAFSMRAPVVLLFCFMLASCGSQEVMAPPALYVPPNMPTIDGAAPGIKQAVAEEKLTGPIEVSDLHETDYGLGRFMVCIRSAGTQPPRGAYYVAFFDNTYKGSRPALMRDNCEAQTFRPAPP